MQPLQFRYIGDEGLVVVSPIDDGFVDIRLNHGAVMSLWAGVTQVDQMPLPIRVRDRLPFTLHQVSWSLATLRQRNLPVLP